LPLAAGRSPLAARRSPLAARRSPLAARRSPLAALTVTFTSSCRIHTLTQASIALTVVVLAMCVALTWCACSRQQEIKNGVDAVRECARVCASR
jgi:hypothetical protein